VEDCQSVKHISPLPDTIFYQTHFSGHDFPCRTRVDLPFKYHMRIRGQSNLNHEALRNHSLNDVLGFDGNAHNRASRKVGPASICYPSVA
jgi:hypothetical protein